MALTRKTAPTETAIRLLNSSAVGDVGPMTCFAMVGWSFGQLFLIVSSKSHFLRSHIIDDQFQARGIAMMDSMRATAHACITMETA